MVAHRMPSRSETVVKYKVLVEFDGMDGRHYVPDEVVQLLWPKPVIDSALEHGFIEQVITESTPEPVEEDLVKEVNDGENNH
jgi:hypothetical protein